MPIAGLEVGLPASIDDVDAACWASLHEPLPELPFAGDRVALAALAAGRLPLLPIDPRFRRSPECA